jgi:hypothetical protein
VALVDLPRTRWRAQARGAGIPERRGVDQRAAPGGRPASAEDLLHGTLLRRGKKAWHAVRWE